MTEISPEILEEIAKNIIILPYGEAAQEGDIGVVKYNFEKRGVLVWVEDDLGDFIFTDQYGEQSDYTEEIDNIPVHILFRNGKQVVYL